MIHTYQGETIHIEILYKNRTSFGIQIDGYGNVQVHVPKRTSEEVVLKLVEGKWDWIQQKRNEMKERLEGPMEREYNPGEGFLYLGNTYPIQISHDPNMVQDHAVFEEDKLHIFVKRYDDQSIQQALKRFYYQQCKTLVEKRVRTYQSHFKSKPRSIRIVDSKKAWGTCDANQQLTFNWKLAMAPLDVIDYVVVHEMCHMVHLNHDRSFWRLVGKIMPDYEQKENWLALSSWKMTI